ncbi:NfeD family protein [Clostridium fallax]|uniref:NfeD-like C-terminal, partner-binding n=1 Tax=Clostridium fallax TaxID=1533 RepID=A0A1M4T8E0_9CLOT|nr:NfeD family protein [Clostridium fallax]SHE40680.1 NfeD-like C-terminal, partner-binding [Clostridium fallax]SQB22645.1 membrane-bound serine protease [Clostridium fallax]
MIAANLSALVLVLLIIGFILVTIEMILPGFGAPGISGGICLLAAVIIGSNTIVEAVIMTMIILAVIGVLLAIIFVVFANKKVISPFVLKDEQKRSDGYISSSDLEYLLGKEGRAITDLRPAGSADFDGVKFDVVTDGEYISKGTNVKIIKVEGVKLLVSRIKHK